MMNLRRYVLPTTERRAARSARSFQPPTSSGRGVPLDGKHHLQRQDPHRRLAQVPARESQWSGRQHHRLVRDWQHHAGLGTWHHERELKFRTRRGRSWCPPGPRESACAASLLSLRTSWTRASSCRQTRTSMSSFGRVSRPTHRSTAQPPKNQCSKPAASNAPEALPSAASPRSYSVDLSITGIRANRGQRSRCSRRVASPNGCALGYLT